MDRNARELIKRGGAKEYSFLSREPTSGNYQPVTEPSLEPLESHTSHETELVSVVRQKPKQLPPPPPPPSAKSRPTLLRNAGLIPEINSLPERRR